MAGPLRKNELFWNLFFQRSKISTVIKLEGGERLGLNSPVSKRRTFFAASRREHMKVTFLKEFSD